MLKKMKRMCFMHEKRDKGLTLFSSFRFSFGIAKLGIKVLIAKKRHYQGDKYRDEHTGQEKNHECKSEREQ